MRAAIFVLFTSSAFAQTYAVQAQSNAQRTAGYQDTTFTTTNVPASFKKLYTLPVNGSIRSHFNIVKGLTVTGASCVGTSSPTTCDVLYATTQSNCVYAFDANANVATAPLWTPRCFGVPDTTYIVNNYFIQGGNSLATQAPIGSFASPVADITNGNLWVQWTAANHAIHLRAIKLTTGVDAFSDITVAATTAGCGGTCTLTGSQQKVTVPLAIAGGKVWLVTSSQNDATPYQGWLIPYSLTTGAQGTVFVSGRNSVSTSSWMSAQGPAVLANGNLVYINGTGTNHATGDYGDTLYTINSATSLIVGFFTPWNQDALSAADIEIGSSGPLLLPDAATVSGQSILFAGKEGCVDVIDPAVLPGVQTGTGTCNATGILQAFNAITQSPSSGTGFFSGSLAYCSNNNGTGTIYAGAAEETIKAYAYNEVTGAITTTPFATAVNFYPYPTSISCSNNSGAAGSKLLWVTHGSTNQAGCYGSAACGSGFSQVENGQAILTVLNGATLAVIYDSQGKDNIGVGSKWLRPALYNGHVFIGTQSPAYPADNNAVIAVFGLGSSAPVWSARVLWLMIAPLGFISAWGAVAWVVGQVKRLECRLEAY